MLPQRGGKQYVDQMLEFNHAMGDDYSGEWLDSSTFVFTALDTASARPPEIGLTEVSVLSDYQWPPEVQYRPDKRYNISNPAGTSPGCDTILPLSGTFGSTRPPQLVAVTVADADNGDDVYGSSAGSSGQRAHFGTGFALKPPWP